VDAPVADIDSFGIEIQKPKAPPTGPHFWTYSKPRKVVPER